MKRSPARTHHRGAPKSGLPATFLPDHEIDRICESQLFRADLLPPLPEPIDIENYVETYLKVSVNFEYLPPGLMGMTTFRAETSVVTIDRALAESTRTIDRHRLRSTYAHEAGHLIFHAVLMRHRIVAARGASQILCREAPLGDGSSDRAEIQANKAIGALLLPHTLVREFVEAQFRPEELRMNEDAVRELARTFNTSRTVARIRLQVLYPHG